MTATGEFDRVTGAGLAPLPVQRPIPVWFGGTSARAYERMGRLADGWFPLVQPGRSSSTTARAVIAESAAAGRAGSRTPSAWRAGSTGGGDADDARRRIERWRAAGATHLPSTPWAPGWPVDDHLGALAAVVGPPPARLSGGGGGEGGGAGGRVEHGVRQCGCRRRPRHFLVVGTGVDPVTSRFSGARSTN